MCSHPVCTRRGWWVRHLKPKTQTLQIRNGWVQTISIPQNVIIHHLIILIPLWRSVQLSVETVTHNTTITSQTRTSEHIRPRRLWEDCNLNQYFLGVCAFSTHRVGIVGVGPWPTSPRAPRWWDEDTFLLDDALKLKDLWENIFTLNKKRLTCSLLAYRDPWCCVGASSRHRSS